jgi:clan AA aspartic protease
MRTGVVRGREARIRLQVRGPRRQAQEIEAVIDTGYTGLLTLPPTVIAALGLPWQCYRRGVLADGSVRLFNVFEGIVMWHRRARHVLVDEADAAPLVGMGLLSGCEMRMQVRPGGKITIRPLP